MFFKVLPLIALLGCLLAGTASAQPGNAPSKPFVHPLFSDGMVLQRDTLAPVWGWATPGARVAVAMGGKTGSAVADAKGEWQVKIGPFPAGGPHTLTISGPQTTTFQNVMSGDVWLCSGQSNMQFGVGIADNAQTEIANANFPNIRLFSVPQKVATSPQSTVAASWQVCTPQTISSGGWGGFSAVAYYFGRELHQKLGVPIGLIHSSYGGTVAEAWTSAPALQTLPDFAPAVARLQASALEQSQPGYEYPKALVDWWAKNDVGSVMGAEFWRETVDATGWKTLDLPANMSRAGLSDFNGVVWFRKEIDLPAGFGGRDLMVRLGTLDGRDTAWFNGTRIGETNDNWTQRQYRVPAGALKAGRNVLAVRLLDTGGNGGFSGAAGDMRLEIMNDATTAPLSLAGGWISRATTPQNQLLTEPQRLTDPNNVTVLGNAMIAPLAPFGIKGALWYQGESNVGRSAQYASLLPTLIRDWRAQFAQDLPFYVVQLANWQATRPEPGESAWAELREAQMKTAQTVPNVGIATAIDIGDAADIHPKNKQEVGRRLALSALAKTYGQQIEFSGPVFRRMQIEEAKIRLFFDHSAGLAFKNETPQGFAIAGADKKFVWADAKIENGAVVVSSPQIANPVAVRYAWADNPVANLVNGAGLPAMPFRTAGN